MYRNGRARKSANRTDLTQSDKDDLKDRKKDLTDFLESEFENNTSSNALFREFVGPGIVLSTAFTARSALTSPVVSKSN